jgi:hypothetical protein
MRPTDGDRCRRLVLAGIGVALAAALAGCSSDDGTPAAGSAATTAATGSPAPATTGAASPATAGPIAKSTGSAAPLPLPARTPAVTNGNQGSVLNSLPGDAANGACVAVGSKPDIRSGTMAAGNFVTARKAFTDQAKTKSQPSIFLYLIPSNAKGLTKVTVKLRSTTDGTTRTTTSDQTQYADDVFYFPVNVSIPARGTWELTATSGGNTGCFSVVFG